MAMMAMFTVQRGQVMELLVDATILMVIITLKFKNKATALEVMAYGMKLLLSFGL